MNAFEYFENTDNESIDKGYYHYPLQSWFEIVEFNDVSCPFMLDKEGNRIAICITQLHAKLNCVKSASGCASSWFDGKMRCFVGLDSEINSKEDAENYRIKNKHKYCGYYVDMSYELFLFTLGAMKHKFAAWNWFNGKSDWDIDDGDGDIYLMHVRSKGSNVFKYGKSIYLIARFRVYLRNEPEEFRKLGIVRYCVMTVKDTSDAEKLLGQEFHKLKGCRVVEGNEYVYVPGESHEEAANNAISVFKSVKDKLGKDVYANTFECFGAKGSVFQLDKDK